MNALTSAEQMMGTATAIAAPDALTSRIQWDSLIATLDDRVAAAEALKDARPTLETSDRITNAAYEARMAVIEARVPDHKALAEKIAIIDEGFRGDDEPIVKAFGELLHDVAHLDDQASVDPDEALAVMFVEWQRLYNAYDGVPRQPDERPEDQAAWDAICNAEKRILATRAAGARGLAVKIAIMAITTQGKASPDGDAGIYYDGGDPDDGYMADLIADAQRLAPDLRLIYRGGDTAPVEDLFRQWQLGIRAHEATDFPTDAEADADIAKVHALFNRMVEAAATTPREMAIKSFLTIQHKALKSGPDAAFLYFGEGGQYAEDRAARRLHADLVRTYPDLFAEHAA